MSEGRIIATSVGRPEEVIENTGRIGFWRRTGVGPARLHPAQPGVPFAVELANKFVLDLRYPLEI